MPVELTLLTVGRCHALEWFANGKRSRRMVTFPAMVALIRHPRAGVILFDTGYGQPLVKSTSRAARAYRRLLPFELPTEEELVAQLERLGAPPRSIDAVFLSHFHPDHIGALREIPRARLIHSAAGLQALRGGSGAFRARSLFLPELLPDDFAARGQAIEDLPLVSLGPEWRPFQEARDVAGDGSLLAVALPGHALGQYGLICRVSGGREVFLVADAAWLRANIAERARPAWPVRFLVADYRAFLEILDRLYELHTRRPEVILIPTHCAESMGAFSGA